MQLRQPKVGRAKQYDVRIRKMARDFNPAQPLMPLMGIGEIMATVIIAMVGTTGGARRRARHIARAAPAFRPSSRRQPQAGGQAVHLARQPARRRRRIGARLQQVE